MGVGSLPLLPLETPGAGRGRNTLTLGLHECVVVDVGCCCSVSVSVVVVVCVCVAIASSYLVLPAILNSFRRMDLKRGDSSTRYRSNCWKYICGPASEWAKECAQQDGKRWPM